MKLVIEIPDYTYESLRDCEGTITIGESIVITKAIRNGTPLPNNPTNGDMIKALFDTKIKDIEIYLTKVYVFIHFKDGNSMRVWKDWWNAPYKRGEEDEASD